jgi:hypothetical protein
MLAELNDFRKQDRYVTDQYQAAISSIPAMM